MLKMNCNIISNDKPRECSFSFSNSFNSFVVSKLAPNPTHLGGKNYYIINLYIHQDGHGYIIPMQCEVVDDLPTELVIGTYEQEEYKLCYKENQLQGDPFYIFSFKDNDKHLS